VDGKTLWTFTIWFTKKKVYLMVVK
jgi:hypothetical protein